MNDTPSPFEGVGILRIGRDKGIGGFTHIPGKTVSRGNLLRFTTGATDPDGDTLAYSLANLPRSGTFDSRSRTFS
ncbi:MAG: hypothetical protein MUO99_02950 [Dehalococcoidales bacterium]|nr:hypothetical protein [Dehalococcoidales bacterium]